MHTRAHTHTHTYTTQFYRTFRIQMFQFLEKWANMSWPSQKLMSWHHLGTYIWVLHYCLCFWNSFRRYWIQAHCHSKSIVTFCINSTLSQSFYRVQRGKRVIEDFQDCQDGRWVFCKSFTFSRFPFFVISEIIVSQLITTGRSWEEWEWWCTRNSRF